MRRTILILAVLGAFAIVGADPALAQCQPDCSASVNAGAFASTNVVALAPAILAASFLVGARVLRGGFKS